MIKLITELREKKIYDRVSFVKHIKGKWEYFISEDNFIKFKSLDDGEVVATKVIYTTDSSVENEKTSLDDAYTDFYDTAMQLLQGRKRVFCDSCKYYSDNSYGDTCTAPDNMSHIVSYNGVQVEPKQLPEEKNKNNSCKSFEKDWFERWFGWLFN